VTADVTNYNSQGFDESYNIPLLGAEFSHYFMKFNRGVITLIGYDLLNKKC